VGVPARMITTMPGMSAHLFDRYEALFGEIYCLTFVRGVGETEALRRMGGLKDTMRHRDLAGVREEMDSYDAGYPRIAQALGLGEWTVIIEPEGFLGSGVDLLNAVSQGTEAVSVLRHDYAEDRFVHGADGTVLTGFVPRSAAAVRWGAEPDRLLAQMVAAGMSLEEDASSFLVHPHVAALRLVGQLVGPLPDLTDGPLLSAHIEPWFSAAEPSSAYRSELGELADALDAAPASLRRAIAVREVRRFTELLGVAYIPDVAEALAAAERGEDVRVPAGSVLGHHVRGWLVDANRAYRLPNDHRARHRMTDEERGRATQLGRLAGALRGALWSDSRPAAYEALKPLAWGDIDGEDGATRRAAILRELREHPVS
jgi:hypothetical protein